ncbi:MAG: hypothetical protein J1F24_07770 [Oscillospiraceae bacterium]|nr:hypothetical protein [Oscillospiraceae bacterium]
MSRTKHIIYKYIIPVVSVFFIVGYFVIVKNAITPLDTPTDTQVWDVFTSHGYTPIDLTDMYVEQNPDVGLVKNVTIKTDDFRLEFFSFDSEQAADRTTKATANDIKQVKRQYVNNCVETYVYRVNIYHLTLTAGGEYYFITQINDTVLYAYGTEESSSEILSIADELGYLP